MVLTRSPTTASRWRPLQELDEARPVVPFIVERPRMVIIKKALGRGGSEMSTLLKKGLAACRSSSLLYVPSKNVSNLGRKVI